MAGMSIGEVARKTGLRPSAIRYYEKLGLLARAPRVGGRRYYDQRALDRLAMVRFARHVGFNIAEIKLLLSDVEERPPPARWRTLARQKAARLGEIIAQARRAQDLLHETLGHQCPKLVERGRALLLRLFRDVSG
jgi:MerR family redox-sensitive transcriptional activator SoxR